MSHHARFTPSLLLNNVFHLGRRKRIPPCRKCCTAKYIPFSFQVGGPQKSLKGLLVNMGGKAPEEHRSSGLPRLMCVTKLVVVSPTCDGQLYLLCVTEHAVGTPTFGGQPCLLCVTKLTVSIPKCDGHCVYCFVYCVYCVYSCYLYCVKMVSGRAMVTSPDL